MSFINAKDSGKHTDHAVTNNGGTVVLSARGSTPSQAVGEKATQSPQDHGGYNRAIRESNYVGGWNDGTPTG